jgi:AcrR family transcriptional regulator
MNGGELTTEARILEVASRLFYERGYEATTMRDLATGVGIKAASLYNHFSGKQAILVRICLDGMEEFYDGALTRIEGVDNVRERLRALIVWLVVSETRYPYAGRIADEQMNALSPRSRKRLLMLRDAFEALIDDVLDEGQTMGIWQISHPRVIALGIIGMCKIDSWYNNKGPFTPEQIGDIYATFILQALTSTTTSR